MNVPRAHRAGYIGNPPSEAYRIGCGKSSANTSGNQGVSCTY
ncbi:hypothetical protein [Terribacillus saccharophilus]